LAGEGGHPGLKPSHFGADAALKGRSSTVVHAVGIPATNLSVNPARSTGPAIFVGGWALAGGVYSFVFGEA
jgi:aquaporin Z